ncbi:hypothetical protein OAS39_03050, partial [Pirellulales bacterium]|nr:hypothetical protein [Pirellulales bacterium]
KNLVAEGEAAKLNFKQSETSLERRQAELDKKGAALEQLSEDLRATQRESLEMRLATEETWLQLQGVLAPAALSRSIAQVRGRLADHHHLAAEEVRKRRKELEAVRVDLKQQHEHLQNTTEDLQRWAQLREQDLEQQAARLVARERELDAQQRTFERREQQWRNERSDYQEEIQRLLGHLRRTDKMAAA